jgi:hypothetical protein
MSPLHVVTSVSNTARWRSRYELYRNFADYCARSGVILWTIEMAFGERPYAITEAGNPHHIRVRADQELWHKENLLDIAMSRLPEEAKYVGWVDSDVQFSRLDWAEETVQQLQHYQVVQMFSHAVDLGPQDQPLLTHSGFVWRWLNGTLFQDKDDCYPGGAKINGSKNHPGYAWAARRGALNSVGGLIDFAIMGSADYHMACGLVGRIDQSFFPNISDGYRDELLDWQDLALRHIKYSVGYVPMTLTHFWHGKKKNRGYLHRWKVLTDAGFDPNRHLYTDIQGVLRLDDDQIAIRDGITRYFRSRNDDSNEV